jgi:hypothetical protein
MPSTFSPSLRIELIGAGEQSGTWNNTTNNNLGDLIEQAISGATTVNVTSADVTLTALNGITDEARSAVLIVTGTPGTARSVIIPNVSKTYTVKNNSDSIVQIKTASGIAYSMVSGSEAYVYCNGSNAVTGRSISTNGNTLISAVQPSSVAQSLGIAPTVSPALTGTPTAPTAPQGTNTTQLATTAFVNAEIANDAPTKTGGGASGTWGINISGNAATATNATNATNLTGTSTANISSSALATGTANSTTYLRGDRSWESIASPSPSIPSGSVILFVQTSAPTGWVKSTAHDNKALRVVSGTAGAGGSVAFTTAFANQTVSATVGGTTLATSQIPSHEHNIKIVTNGGDGGQTAIQLQPGILSTGFSGGLIQSTGGGGSHTHSFTGTAIDMAVQYVDVIICTKS